MDKNLHTTIDYKKLIEIQANEVVARMEKTKNTDNKTHSSSKSKVKTIRRRNS